MIKIIIKISTFLNIKDIIYCLQFGFCQNYSASYALIHLTKSIKEALDQGKYGCGIFVDLQKVFDTVDHNILLGKLKHYGIRGVAYGWFESYLTINAYNSKLEICQFLLVFHKALFLDQCYFLFTSMI